MINQYSRPGSCDIGSPIKSKPKEDKIEDIPRQLLYKMKSYASKLAKKHPSMKPDRVRELTAKKFNIKLV